jgi:hypothetical protein
MMRHLLDCANYKGDTPAHNAASQGGIALVHQLHALGVRLESGQGHVAGGNGTCWKISSKEDATWADNNIAPPYSSRATVTSATRPPCLDTRQWEDAF